MPDPLLGAEACIVSCESFAISAIWPQSKQSDCNLSNLTAISAIGLQSQQSDCILSNQNQTPSNMPETLLGAGMCICKLWNFCNLSNLTAISAIRLQSSWIAVRLQRLIWIAKQNCNPRLQWIALGLHRLPFDCFGLYCSAIHFMTL